RNPAASDNFFLSIRKDHSQSHSSAGTVRMQMRRRFPLLGNKIPPALSRYDKLLFQHANARKIAIPLAIIQSVAHDKFIGDIESDVIRFHWPGPRLYFPKQNANTDTLRRRGL